MTPSDKPRLLCMADMTLAPEALDMLREVCRVDYRPADYEDLLQAIGDYDFFWGHVDLKVDANVLARTDRLKAILTASTGTDHIDKREAARRGIRILSITRDYSLLDTFTATAECAWMLLLACQRHFRAATASVFEGRWEGERFRGRQLLGRTLGVLGLGRLGQAMARMAQGFRMRVLGCDREPFQLEGVEPVDFDTMLRESDAVAVHIHMEDGNRHLFDDGAFAKMKQGAILVNTSRGDLIDEAALLRALESGRLAAFGADVLHDEWREDMRESKLVQYALSHPNVVITPHVGGCTTESLRGARLFAARKLVHYVKTGRELRMDHEAAAVEPPHFESAGDKRAFQAGPLE